MCVCVFDSFPNEYENNCLRLPIYTYLALPEHNNNNEKIIET